MQEQNRHRSRLRYRHFLRPGFAFGEGQNTFCIASSPTRKGYIECGDSPPSGSFPTQLFHGHDREVLITSVHSSRMSAHMPLALGLVRNQGT
jgi:hypothetical protein